MNTIKEIFKKIGSGLLYGIGIGISAGLLVTFISLYFGPTSLFNANKAEKNLVITEHRDIKRNDNVYIFGTVENQTDEKVRSFNIQADFFDGNGTFIDQCKLYVSTFPSTKTYNFKISCNYCDKKTPIKYSSYKVYVTEGL
ncbi:MAG: FxLYD domain-containing protein [Campylobacterota bacterium]